ncbi:hypothetical protein [Pseudoalteromonas espejiana]|uniref:Uncharacterized protein n=1 Tax=Pseudoalteromonas espejiana TaxID=28107 RepID=A0A510XTK8_9GAMM|nr:hypothetical protein [Pseudoalteromonas espejiana]GEK54333.1 hypothetical protein PES01_11780 [Pseudoalteromonas espejiana]
MFAQMKKAMSKGIWHSIAVIIVLLVAGPEFMVSMELLAMVEMLGASTFVLMYVSGLKLFFAKLLVKYRHFERHSILIIPTIENLRQMPSLVFHAIPERTFIVCYLVLIITSASVMYTGTLINAS